MKPEIGVFLSLLSGLAAAGCSQAPSGPQSSAGKTEPLAAPALAGESGGGAAAVADAAVIRVTSPSPIRRDVEAGEKVTTPCFRFTVAVKSAVRGDGCAVQVSVWTPGPAPNVPYFSVQMLNDEPPGATPEQMVALMLEGMKAKTQALERAGRGTYRGENPGPYDTDFGRYLGTEPLQFRERPSIVMRWGVEPRPGQHVIDLSCDPSAGAPCAAKPGLEAYRSVKFNQIVRVRPGRYVWDGIPIAWLLLIGYEKGYEWQPAKAARESLELL